MTEDTSRFSNGPLGGIRVLDLSSVVSGPMTAMVLADQGADVIKVEPPGWGDGIRNLGASRNGLAAIFAMVNRNKRSLAVNLKHPTGAELVLKLAESVDVVLQNYRPGKMDKLGLGYEQVKAVNPDVIYASISGMGEVGPYAEQKVYDYVIQGMSGVLDAQSVDGQPSMVRTIIFDKVTALTAAQGITAALLARANGAGGQHVKLTMLDAGVYFNWPDLMWNYSFEGDGVRRAGDLADIYQVNQAADGYIVTQGMGLDCSEYPTDQLIELFAQNDIPVARANSREEVLDDPQVKALGVLESIDHPRGGAMVQPRPAAQFSVTSTRHQRPSPEVGEHTVEILGELGLSLEEMRALARAGAIG
jgi:crotonobetainyl-CoA:carnitine CoA-transferase CaiB-like acyl-CoA transferase